MNAEEIELHVVAGALGPLLEAVAREKRISGRRYLLHAVERTLCLLDPGMISDELRETALGLGLARSLTETSSAPFNAILVPFAANDFGFVRTLFVTFRPWSPILDEALSGSRATARSVERALAFAAEDAGRGNAQGHTLTAAQPHAFESISITGDSMAAAAYVSAASLWTRRSVTRGTVVTGSLRGREVHSVGGLAAKLDGIARAPMKVHTFVVPESDRAALPDTHGDLRIVGVSDVRELLDVTLSPTPSRPMGADDLVQHALRSFRGAWQGWHWPGLQAELERLLAELPGSRPDLLVYAYAMLGGVIRHQGYPEESLDILERARAILATDDGKDGVPDAPLSFFHRQRAMAHRQVGALDEAWAAALEAIQAAEHGRLRGELIPSHGTAGLIATSLGNDVTAIDHHRKALSISLRHTPGSASRSSGYLVESLTATSKWDEARAAFDAGLEQVELYSSERSRSNRASWLRVAYAGGLVRGGRISEALEILDAPCVSDAMRTQPLPGLLVRRYLGIARVRSGLCTEGYALLAASPTAYGQLLGAHTGSLAQQNILHEAVLRLDNDQLTDDARARALRAIDEIPAYDAAAVWLQPVAAGAKYKLDSGEADAADAIRALLDACERLG